MPRKRKTEAELRQEYQTGTAPRIVAPDGSHCWEWDCPDGVIPPGHERKKIPFTEIHSTFEEWMRKWVG